MVSHTVLPLSAEVLGFAEVIAPRLDMDGEGIGLPPLFQSKRMRRLSTPWEVCKTRAEQLAARKLPDGLVLDPACGSGMQLYAYCLALGRGGLGIELDSDSAVLSAANGRLVAEAFGGDWVDGTEVLVGDGTDSAGAMAATEIEGRCISVLHVDPARPPDAQRHALNEMQPPIDTLVDAWSPHMVSGRHGPAFVIDLSPRLLPEQQKEVENILTSRWPDSPITWEWVSTGRGRIDRLTIWFGGAADPGTPARMLRLLPNGTVVSFAGRASEPKPAKSSSPKEGHWLTLVDTALLSSGLQGQWLREAFPDDSPREWVCVDGRRPMLLSDAPPDIANPLVSAFISSTGEIKSRLKVEPTMANLAPMLVTARSAYLSRLTLRCKMDPSEQPVLQSELDKGLRSHPRGNPGFLTEVNTPSGVAWFVCKEPNQTQ